MNTPYFFYKMMITDEIIQLFVRETNIYAHQQKNQNTSKHSRVQTWKDTTEDEMETFLGCLMWLGLVQLPSLSAYWSKKKIVSKFTETYFIKKPLSNFTKNVAFCRQ